MLEKSIYKAISKYENIVVARHIGPDPDALASELALKEIILKTMILLKFLLCNNDK